MDVEVVPDRLMDAGVFVWLYAQERLRMNKGAPNDIKELVRVHKHELIDVCKSLIHPPASPEGGG